MKATVKAKYDVDKKTAASVAALSVPALGDSKLKLSLSDSTFLHGLSLDGLSLSLEKPGHFIFDYSFPSKDFRFQFMNTVRVLEKPLSLTYIHFRGPNRTTLDGTLTVDPANKLTASYDFASGGCRVRYAYAHGDLRRTTFEPAYDLRKGAWDFAMSRKFEGVDIVRATYRAESRDLGVEWSRDSKTSGIFKLRCFDMGKKSLWACGCSLGHGWYCNYVEVSVTGLHAECTQSLFTVEQWLALDGSPYELTTDRDICDVDDADY